MKTKLIIILTGLIFSGATLSAQKLLTPRFNHVMLHVSDIEASIAFYTKAFDLEVTNQLNSLQVAQADGTTTTVEIKIAFLKFPGQGFVYEMSENKSGSGETFSLYQHVGIEVLDIESALKQALEAGGNLVSPIKLVTADGVSAKTVFLKGPDGELIEFMQMISGEF